MPTSDHPAIVAYTNFARESGTEVARILGSVPVLYRQDILRPLAERNQGTAQRLEAAAARALTRGHIPPSKYAREGPRGRFGQGRKKYPSGCTYTHEPRKEPLCTLLALTRGTVQKSLENKGFTTFLGVPRGSPVSIMEFPCSNR